MSSHGVLVAPDTIRFERVLPGSIERAWSYITDSQKRAKWLAAGPMELKVGGKVALSFDNDNLGGQHEKAPAEYADPAECHVTGTVTLIDAPRTLVFSWRFGTDEASEVTFELSPHGKDTRLVLTHRKLARTDLTEVGPGWHTHLGILVDRLAEREASAFWTTFLRLKAEYAERLAAGAAAMAQT